jgi:glycosyltransferase involved in cell wall biosynthesis
VTEHSLLLLIPAYNEECRIEPVLRDYARYFKEHHRGKFQLVVVLNGCTDNTLEVVRRVGADYPAVTALEFPDAIGKGGALIEGLKLAPLADLIGYVDADGATPPRAFHDLVRHIEEADCVIGSRWLPGAVLHVEQSGQRRFASRAFHLIVQCLFWMNIRDTQCGAKVMRREAVEKVHSSLRIADMAFDINLLYSLKRAGYRILEVPTEWTDKIGSKVTLFGTSLVMFLSAVRIWLIYSPRLYKWLRPLRPLEGWVYGKLRAPQPRPGPPNPPAVSESVTSKQVSITLQGRGAGPGGGSP